MDTAPEDANVSVGTGQVGAAQFTHHHDMADGLARALDFAKEALNECKFPNELLEVWACREEELLRDLAAQPRGPPSAAMVLQGETSPTPELPRAHAVWLMLQLARHLALPPEGLAKAVTLLDVYCSRTPGDCRIHILPGICAAICSILKKSDAAFPQGISRDLLRTVIVLMSRVQPSCPWVGLIGHLGLGRMEQRVLQVLQWHIDPATVESWIVAMTTRMNVATHGVFMTCMDWIRCQATNLARSMLQRMTMMELEPKRAARGLICHGLVIARLLPLEMLRPADVNSQIWEQFFRHSQWGAVPACALPPQGQSSVFAFLKMATSSTSAELRQDALRIASAMQSIKDIEFKAQRPHLS